MSERDGSGATTAKRAGVEIERIVPGTPEWEELLPEHLQRYELAAGHVTPGARVLDAGCGVGYGAATLADRGAARVIAVDIAADALAVARERFVRPAITWVRDDCQTLRAHEVEGPFDLICNLENLEHLPEPSRFLARARDLLAPEGALITSTPNRYGVNRLRGNPREAATTNPFHEREYSITEFRALLEEYFAEVRMVFQTYDPVERMHLEPALAAVWGNPAMRVGRWFQRVMGRSRAQRLEELLPPRRYQILEINPGDESVITQIAICRRPRDARV